MTASIESQAKVYRIATGWKWFFLIVVPPLICLFGLPFIPRFTPVRSPESGWVLVPLISGSLCLLLLLALISLVKTRLEIDEKEVRLVGLFKTAVMRRDEIAGFRIVQGVGFILVAKNPANRKVKIPSHFEKQGELLAWAQSTLVNLDFIRYQEEVMEISQNDSIGTNPEERAGYYKRAKRCCLILTCASFAALIWAMFWPKPYVLATSILLLLPWIALLVLALFRGVVKIDDRQKSAYPSVATAFILPCAGLAIRGLLDWNVLEWSHFWGPFVCLSGSLLATTLLLAKDARKFVMGSLVGIFCAVYGYGGILALNGVLAKSPPTPCPVKVVGKSICAGKPPTHYLKLSPWRNRSTNEDMEVAPNVYAEYAVGSTVVVWVREGRFGIPFYVVQFYVV